MKQKFRVTGMTCSACSATVNKVVSKLSGVISVNVNLLSNNMIVDYDEKVLSCEEIIQAVINAGYQADLYDNKTQVTDTSLSNKVDELSEMKKRVIISFIFFIPMMYISMGHMIYMPNLPFLDGYNNSISYAFFLFLLTIPVVFINRKYYIIGFSSLFRGSPNMDSLVAIGSFAAILYGIFAIFRIGNGLALGDHNLVNLYKNDLYFESAVTILTLITLGKYLEASSKKKTSKSIEKLLDLTPKKALVERDNKEMLIPVEDIVIGDIVIIKPGESIAVDGVVISGSSSIDQSAITGESIPIEKKIGDNVIAATINKTGSLKVKALKIGADTTISQIIALVEEASNSKAPISKLADKVSGIFVPVVIFISILSTIYWLLNGQSLEFALSMGISVLVISCPCALGLATPVAVMVGTGKGAENGILIKSAEALESAYKLNAIVLDKTGTITEGKIKVSNIYALNQEESSVLKIAASLEKYSEHPIGKAIYNKALENNISLYNVEDFQSFTGGGIKGNIENTTYYCGKEEFVKSYGIDLYKYINKDNLNMVNSPVFICNSSELLGIIYLSDFIKETSISAIKELKKLGLDIYMLTGDNETVAKNIAEKAGIINYKSNLMPQDKESFIRKLQAEGKITAMVGDGINDAPALARSDLGIAIGAGTDIAIQSADIVLVRNNLEDVVSAIILSDKTIKNIKMNLFWAFFYNIIGIPIAAGIFYNIFHGLKLNPMIAAAAMSFSSVFVVLNALRLRNVEIKNKKGDMTMKKLMNVEGMSCNHCKMTVEKVLNAIDGVSSVSVDLDNKTVEVSLSENSCECGCSINNKLINAVNEAGFNAVSIKDI